MRRQKKFIVNGGLIVAGIFAGVDIFLQHRERKQQGLSLGLDNFDYWRTIKKSVLGFAVGGTTGYLYYQYLIKQERSLPFSPQTYLKDVISQEHLKNNPKFFQDVLTHRIELKHWLANHFCHELVATPEDGGSFYKRTAISSNYDLDIILPFKRNSYSSLKSMYDSLSSALKQKYRSHAIISERTKTIRVEFENNGTPICFDIVPGREIYSYSHNKKLNLYKKPDWIWQRGGSFKIDVERQKSLVMNKPEARQVIKLLKAYRDRNNLPLPTVVIEQSVVNALEKNQFGISKSLDENLMNCMDYICVKLDQGRLIDISNSNNNLIECLSSLDRQLISDQLSSDIKKMNDNPRFVTELFEQE